MGLFLVVMLSFCKNACGTGANLAVKPENFTLISIIRIIYQSLET